MALTYGFYNSYAGDRKYDAMQISEMFDGILADGIIPSQGQLFAVTAGGGMTINVGTGRAWFFHSWTKNDSVMMLTVPASDVSRPRIDAVVLEVNRDQEVRANSIKIVSGEAAVNPVKPTLVTTDKVHQYPLAYITVGAGVEEIKAENIENAVGLTPTPFATGVLETTPLDELWSQWEGEWDTWFANIKLQLSGDIVTNLQGQIDACMQALTLDFNVPDDVLELWGITDIVGNDKKFKTVLEGLFKPDIITKTEIFTSSGTWAKPDDFISADVFVMGGGGGGQAGRGADDHTAGQGGFGGFSASKTITASQLGGVTQVAVTIGTGGAGSSTPGCAGSSGGVSSFGTYVSASGGASGGSTGSGGSGGGGGGGQQISYNTMCPNGANGSLYGGGGAAGVVGQGTSTYGNGKTGYNGGRGGSYGGGGGGSGGTAGKSVSGSGGLGGGGGQGSGGAGGGANVSGGQDGFSGTNGTNTLNLDLPFTGPGTGGSGGNKTTAGGSGGGGGGYGGKGGKGGNATSNSGTDSSQQFRYGASSGGGGGGGYGGNGGNGGESNPPITTEAYMFDASVGGGGGGGGYGANGGRGGNGYSSGTSHDYLLYCHGGGGGGGGYGANGSGGNGGSAYDSGYASRKGGIAAGGGGGCAFCPSSGVSSSVLENLYRGGDGGSGVVVITYKYYQWRYNKK